MVLIRNFFPPANSTNTSGTEKTSQTTLASLDRYGKAFGWIAASFSALTAFFAFIVAMIALSINEDNLTFQRQNISMQALQRMLADYSTPSQVNGLVCIEFLLHTKEPD